MTPDTETVAITAIANALGCTKRRAAALLHAANAAGLSGAYIVQCCRYAGNTPKGPE